MQTVLPEGASENHQSLPTDGLKDRDQFREGEGHDVASIFLPVAGSKAFP